MAALPRDSTLESATESGPAFSKAGASHARSMGASSATTAPVQPADAQPPLDHIYAEACSIGDQAAERDSLGFELYVNCLADFLLAEKTRPPLTFSIEGSWGSGKSSFMLQLKNRLHAISPGVRTINFNAWKYDKQEELWAAFALNLTRSLRSQTSWHQRFLGDLKLYFSRIKGIAEVLKLATFAAAWLALFTGVIVTLVAFSQTDDEGRATLAKQAIEAIVRPDKPAATPPAGANSTPAARAAANALATQEEKPRKAHYWLANSSWAAAGVVLLGLLWKIPESVRKRLFSTHLEEYIDKPDYKGRAAFLDTFSKDFARTIKAYSPNSEWKTFVFIDDLDRCEAPKAADLMQAINLMIGEGNSLIFLLGLDRAKVAAAIAFKYREMIPYLLPASAASSTAPSPAAIRDFGDSFLEKFIQLSFRLPISSNNEQARRFIDSLIAAQAPDAKQARSQPTPSPVETTSTREARRIETGPDSERIRDVVMSVREVLEHSPRRIKTFLNSFRLALYIASAQGLLDTEAGIAEVTPEQLGRFLAITNRYPELLGILHKDRNFLTRLEEAANGEIRDGMPEWLRRPGVIAMLDRRNDDPNEKQARSLRNFPHWKFDTVVPTTPPPPRRDRREGESDLDRTSGFRSQANPEASPNRPFTQDVLSDDQYQNLSNGLKQASDEAMQPLRTIPINDDADAESSYRPAPREEPVFQSEFGDVPPGMSKLGSSSETNQKPARQPRSTSTSRGNSKQAASRKK